MAIAINDYSEFEELVHKLWDRTPLFGFFLHDSRVNHQMVIEFLRESAGWLDELAVQCGMYILFPLKSEGEHYANPSPIIAKKFGLQPNRLPGIVLMTTTDQEGNLRSNHFLFVPLSAADFGDIANMQATLADIFSIVQSSLSDGNTGHDALDAIRLDLSRRRRIQKKERIVEALRSGAQIVLKQFPEKFITSFAGGLGNALGGTIVR